LVQIFLAHSSKDEQLIRRIANALEAIGVYGYIAEDKSPSPISPREKLEGEIAKSQALFVLLTRNLARSVKTISTVQWEITKAQDKKKPVYVFVEKRVRVPLMVSQTVDYREFDPLNEVSFVEAIGRMKNIAEELKIQEIENKALQKKAIEAIGKTIADLLPPAQPKLALEINVGFLAQGRQLSEPTVSIRAGNQGLVPLVMASLSSLQIVMPDRKFLIPRRDTWQTDKEFPFELGPGAGYAIWRDMKGFVDGMKKNGYSGVVKLRPICRDQAGRLFEGGDFMLDVDGWFDDWVKQKLQS
jgi:hypothetical protein